MCIINIFEYATNIFDYPNTCRSIFWISTNIFDYPNRSRSLPCIMRVGWRTVLGKQKGTKFHIFFHPFDFNFEVKNPWIPLIFISFMWSFDFHKTREISTFHSFYSYPHFHRLSFTQNEQILRMCLFAGKESVKWEKLKVKWCGINTLTIYFNSKFFISVDFVSNSFHPIEGILR